MRALLLITLLAACGGGDDGGEPGTFTVTGVARYEDRPQLASGSLGPAEPLPIRSAKIAVIAEDDGLTLAMGTTDESGAFSLTFDGVSGEDIHITVIAQSTLAARPVAVRRVDASTGTALDVHAFGGDTFGAGDGAHDVLVTVASGEAGAFNIHDVLGNMMDRVPAAFAATTPPPLLSALWQNGSEDGTYYLNDLHEMHLLGEASDDDGFDDAVILHEAGHYIEDVIGRTDSPGGDHDGSPTDPRLAWSEGFSTYISMAVRDVPLYIDTNMGDGFVYDGDMTVTAANAGGAIGQDVSEDMITEILWDMGDGGAGDDDALAGTHDVVLKVAPFMRTATLRNVGKTGADLVDALDGWFITNGLASCAAMRMIVNTTHAFPYDYGSSAGVCPP